MPSYRVTAAALFAALSLPALGQQGSPPAPGFLQSQGPGDWRGSRLIGAIVYDTDNASIGEITDVLIAGDGTVRAVVVGVGGVAGLADKDVAVPFAALRITPGAAPGMIDKITVGYSRQQLNEAPRFAFDERLRPQTSGTGSAPHQ
ncbi:MAG TPA: PRC-barrel domain-containing protein [Pseudolabrys sp.]|nr:PRC-barrel domain-containing protein [Pseudolabrys sp.]